AISAVHTDAPSARDTDWSQIVALYDRLVAIDPSPIVRLNRAVAVAELDGPDLALTQSTGSPRPWTPTTPGTSRAPTCCGGSGAATTPGRPTPGRSGSPATRRSGPT